MERSEIDCHQYVTVGKQSERMMVQGTVSLTQAAGGLVEMQRGMEVFACDGIRVGALAALMLDERQQKITYLLLCRLPETAVYRQIPISLISQVDAETVYINIPSHEIETLMIHQPILT